MVLKNWELRGLKCFKITNYSFGAVISWLSHLSLVSLKALGAERVAQWAQCMHHGIANGLLIITIAVFNTVKSINNHRRHSVLDWLFWIYFTKSPKRHRSSGWITKLLKGRRSHRTVMNDTAVTVCSPVSDCSVLEIFRVSGTTPLTQQRAVNMAANTTLPRTTTVIPVLQLLVAHSIEAADQKNEYIFQIMMLLTWKS